MTENVGQAVVGRVRRAAARVARAGPGGRGRPRGSRRVHQGAGGGRLLPAPAAGQVRRATRPIRSTFYTRRPADRQRLRVHRLGVLGGRPAPWQRRPVPAAGPARGLGRGPGDQDLLVLRPDREGRGGRRRLQAVRALELFLRLRPLHLGAARRPRARAAASRSTSGPSCCPPRLPDRRRLGHRRAARHRQQRHRGGRRARARAPLAQLHRHAPAAQLPGQEPNPAPLYRLPVRVGVLLLHHHGDHRHGDRRLRRACGVPAQAGPRRLRRRRRRADDPYSQVRVATAAAEIDAAWLRAGAQHDRADGVRAGRGEDPAAAPAADPARSGARDRRGRSAPSTCCSRTPAAGPWRRAPRSSGSGGTRTPAGCMPSTTRSGPCRCSAAASSASTSGRTRCSERSSR